MMNNKLSENLGGGVFPDEEIFNKIYEKCLEDRPQATEEIRETYGAMHDNFERYLSAIEEWMFRHAYQCGYEAALQHLQKGGAAV